LACGTPCTAALIAIGAMGLYLTRKTNAGKGLG
jgi:hypothetical protein